MAKSESFEQYVRRRPDAPITGFYYCEGDGYHVVVLAGKTGDSDCWAESFAADSAEELVAACFELGMELGSPERIKDLCERAPRSRAYVRRRKAVRDAG